VRRDPARTARSRTPRGSPATPETPCGFCAVRHVIAVVPKTPCEANVSRSAWMPAPAPLSEPAMLRATGSSRLEAV
jgi:hypothetical protein